MRSADGGPCGQPGLLEQAARRHGVRAVEPHDAGARAADKLIDRALAHDPSAVDDRDRVAGALDLVQQVRAEHHRPSLVDQRADHRAHLVHPRWVEPVHRLVQDQQLGVAEQARRDPQALAHAHRVRGDLVVGTPCQADSGQRWPDPPVRSAASRGGQQAQVIPARQVVVEAGLVDDRADPGQRPAPLGRDRDPEQGHRAGVGPRQAEQGADERRLAGAVRSQVAERGPARDKQLDVVDRDVRAEPLGQAVGLDRPSAGRSPGQADGAGRARRSGPGRVGAFFGAC